MVMMVKDFAPTCIRFDGRVSFEILRDAAWIEHWLNEVSPPGKLDEIKATIHRCGFYWGRLETPIPEREQVIIRVVIGELRQYQIHWLSCAFLARLSDRELAEQKSGELIQEFTEWIEKLEVCAVQWKRSSEGE
jgi:hypothetical protein